MSIFTAMNSAYSLEEAFGAKDRTSEAMQSAIKEWFALYYEREATKDSDPCQRIAYTVVNKLCKTCFGEYDATSKDEYAQKILAALDTKKRRALQMLLAGGEAFIKPVPEGKDGWAMNIIRRDNFLVFGRDDSGMPNDIGTTERTLQGRYFYTLAERRRVGPDGRLTITNKLYQSLNETHLGQLVPLQTLDQYTALAPEYTYSEPMGLGLVHLRVPIENVVDGSSDGVAVYAAAVGLIRNIDRNEAQINGEFERGQSKVFASADLMRRDKEGRRRFDDDIFVALDDAPDAIGLTVFSPDLRVQSFHERKREYLRNVETVMGIKRGLVSEVEAQERTAKEVTSSEGDYNLTIIDLQETWTTAVKDTVKLCSILGKLYSVSGAHEVPEDAVNIDWGNGVLYDEDKTWADYLDMVSRGLLKPEIAIGWRFGMPTDTPADLQKIREKYMPELERMAEGGEE